MFNEHILAFAGDRFTVCTYFFFKRKTKQRIIHWFCCSRIKQLHFFFLQNLCVPVPCHSIFVVVTITWLYQCLENFVNRCLENYTYLFLLHRQSAEIMSATQEHVESGSKTCCNPGNPVFSCMLPGPEKGTHWTKPQHLFYKTTNGNYGHLPPVPETTPLVYRPKSFKFSRHMLMYGMHRDNSLNTAISRSRVCDYPNLQHTL